MAGEDKKPSHPYEAVFLILGLLVFLGALWLVRGGKVESTGQGIFLHPPAPLDSGTSYGPRVGSTTNR